MTKKLLATAMMMVFCITGMMAQDASLTENRLDGFSPMQTSSYGSAATLYQNANRFAFSLQLPYNYNKMGIGMRFAYNFTDVLRFSLDGDYYFYASPLRTFNVITNTGEKGTMGWGKLMDVNTNLNFVYGEHDFHFYVITGLYFSYGYRELMNDLSSIEGNNTVIINHVTYYYKDKLIPSIGLGINGGCGIEYQITDGFRMFFEQQLSLGLMTSWMAKLGASFCF